MIHCSVRVRSKFETEKERKRKDKKTSKKRRSVSQRRRNVAVLFLRGNETIIDPGSLHRTKSLPQPDGRPFSSSLKNMTGDKSHSNSSQNSERLPRGTTLFRVQKFFIRSNDICEISKIGKLRKTCRTCLKKIDIVSKVFQAGS